MRLQKKFIIIALFLTQMAAAGESGGSTGMAFLKVGVGARAAGMGEAFTAVSDDALATYWNPAGLLAAKLSNVSLMHNRWLRDVTSQFGALQFRRKASSLAFHVYSFSVDDIPVRDRPSSNPLEQTGANFLSIGASYARSLSQTLDFGVTVKYLFEKVFVYTADGYAADIGFRYTGFGEQITVAGVLQNLGSMSELLNESTKLPATLRLGAQYDLSSVIIAGDLVKPFEEDLRFNVGAEANVVRQIVLRAGYQAGYESRNVSFGAGIRKSSFHFDYSYTPFSDDLGNGQRISIFLAL